MAPYQYNPFTVSEQFKPPASLYQKITLTALENLYFMSSKIDMHTELHPSLAAIKGLLIDCTPIS